MPYTIQYDGMYVIYIYMYDVCLIMCTIPYGTHDKNFNLLKWKSEIFIIWLTVLSKCTYLSNQCKPT